MFDYGISYTQFKGFLSIDGFFYTCIYNLYFCAKKKLIKKV